MLYSFVRKWCKYVEQLTTIFTDVEVVSGGYLSSREEAR